MTGQALRLTVAMLTYLRPADLVVGVPLLMEQLSELDRADMETSVLGEIIIVDNDPAGSARATIEALAHPRLHYVLEPVAGIAAARNRALDEASESDLLVFIDDDERPHKGWLTSLVRTYLATGAAAVAGPVESEFSGELDSWVAAGAFFKRRRLPTGTDIQVAATNNLLLDLHQVRSLDLRFDARFGLTGAEDTFFTRTLSLSGATMVWCNEAWVTDVVPASRMTRSWVLRRAFSSGNSAAITAVELSGGLKSRTGTRLIQAAAGVPRFLGGGLRYLLGLALRSRHHQTRGLRSLFRGLGMLTGGFGLVFQEYGRQKVRWMRLHRFSKVVGGESSAPMAKVPAAQWISP